jgi:hypothetical protein
MGFNMNAYWDQWSHAELMSMHGVELEECQNDDLFDYHDDKEEIEGCCATGCMDCLGLSWSDFI